MFHAKRKTYTENMLERLQKSRTTKFSHGCAWFWGHIGWNFVHVTLMAPVILRVASGSLVDFVPPCFRMKCRRGGRDRREVKGAEHGNISPNIIGMNILKVKGWAEHVVRMGRREILGYRILIRNAMLREECSHYFCRYAVFSSLQLS